MQTLVDKETKISDSGLEEYFEKFRKNITGIDKSFVGPYGEKKIIYADWIASGRLYSPIEMTMAESIGQYVANTHTETSFTGTVMTKAYHEAKEIIKKHVNATKDDIFIPTGTGMTGAVLKLQRMLGFKYPEQVRDRVQVSGNDKPVVFITHMEHHSNQTSWLETICDVVKINPNSDGLVDLGHLSDLLKEYKERKIKIASITSCSNVTGIKTPYYEVAKLMHANAGLCFVDFACSAPYVKIDMHPEDKDAQLDAIFFSPHKFLG